MEISPLTIYLIDIGGSIGRLFEIVLLVSLAATMCFVILYYEYDIRKIKMSLKNGHLKWTVTALIISTLGCIFIPSKDALIQMLIVPPIVNNEQVQQLPTNVLTYVNDWLAKQNGDKQ